MIKIVADQNMPALERTFARHGELIRLDGRRISHADVRDAEVLLVRSVTPVNAALLQDTAVRFVGSATIGIDHLDTRWLEANNIDWAHAPGCNADAAAQYTLAMMWLACDRLQQDFRTQTVGIIGRGNVGKRLQRLLQALDIPVVACDPPLQERGEPGLVAMPEACDSSIISLHVPLSHNGRHASKDLFDLEQIRQLRAGTLLVNTCRGGVVEKTALLQQLRSGHLRAALDVWPDEPYIARELLSAVTVASPHIAGYSREGKYAGTDMIYQAYCRTLELDQGSQAGAKAEEITLKFTPGTSADDVLRRLLQSSCPVARDDAALRALRSPPGIEKRVQFDSLRSGYPQRFEFKSHRVTGVAGKVRSLLAELGFKTT